MDDPKIIDGRFRVIRGAKTPPPHEPAINWRNVPYFLWVVVVLIAAQLIFKEIMGY